MAKKIKKRSAIDTAIAIAEYRASWVGTPLGLRSEWRKMIAPLRAYKKEKQRLDFMLKYLRNTDVVVYLEDDVEVRSIVGRRDIDAAIRAARRKE